LNFKQDINYKRLFQAQESRDYWLAER